jgi:hypothetical protein
MELDPRWVRGQILRVLHAAHPQWVPDHLLRHTLADRDCAISEETLRSELVYLRDWPARGDGYIDLQLRRVLRSGEQVGVSRITPRGINLVEKLCAPDPQITEF